MPTEQQSAAARRRALRDAQREAAEAAAAATDAKQQLLAAKARTNLLSSEAANLRTRLRQLLDKGRRDEEYIKLLQVKNRREKWKTIRFNGSLKSEFGIRWETDLT